MVIDQIFYIAHDLGVSTMRCRRHLGNNSRTSILIPRSCWLRMEDEWNSEQPLNPFNLLWRQPLTWIKGSRLYQLISSMRLESILNAIPGRHVCLPGMMMLDFGRLRWKVLPTWLVILDQAL